MRSKWIQHRGVKIFYQDFSGFLYDSAGFKRELTAVQAEVVQHPKNSLLILSDLRDTNVTNEMMPVLNASSAITKDHVHKTAVLGVTGIKRTLGDLLTRLTGQRLKYFDNETAAKDWLALDD